MNSLPSDHVRAIEDSKHLLTPVLHGLVQRRIMRSEEMAISIGATLRKVAESLHAHLISMLLLGPNGNEIRIRHTYVSTCAHQNDDFRRNAVESRIELLQNAAVPNDNSFMQSIFKPGVAHCFHEGIPPGTCFDAVLQPLDCGVQSVAAAPLKIHDKIIGCLVAVNKCPDDQDVTGFSDEDLELLKDIAAHVGKLMQRERAPTVPLPERDIASFTARLTRCEFLPIGPDFDVDVPLMKEVGLEHLKRYMVLPLAKLDDKRIRAAVSNPQDHVMLSDFQIATGFHIAEKTVAAESDIRDALQRAFPGGSGVSKAVEQIAKEFVPFNLPADFSAETTENSAPIVNLSNRIIEDAYTQGASDIHVEPAEQSLVVRYRIDGVCREKLALPKTAHPALVARLKIMSDLDISEHRLPQDGRIVFKKFSPKFDLDLRVSVVPSNHGESVVMRILDKTKSTLPLEKLGFSSYNLGLYRQLINIPYGMILHCGPTGSGKSMTLYAALNEINSPEYKILTAEDPIEYTLPRLIQVQIKKDIGLTFASALRCFLRQDPDIILVGEIRDRETAEIAIEAALTGHVLFSTLHTNDAASTITRLMEIGIEPFLISTTLACICAQRLIRRLCACKCAADPTEEQHDLLTRARDPAPIKKIFRPSGCDKCDKTGYKGRTGIHEMMSVSNELRELISNRASAEQMKAAARRGGMRTLFEDAMEKVKAGISSMPEALSTARPDEQRATELIEEQ